jgi:hypothetical protein
MAEWRTKSRWLHWDLNPFHWVDGTMPAYEFCPYSLVSESNGCSFLGGKAKVQGLLNLIDARVQDGGFLCVPGFHKHLREWTALEVNQDCRERMKEALDFMDVPELDPMQHHTQSVPMRARSLLIWNSELPHCNYPNDSSRFRMVQYVKCFPSPGHVSVASQEEAGALTLGVGKEKAVGAAGAHKREDNGMSQRRALLTSQVRSSLGAKRVEQMTDKQRAILGLQDYSPAGLSAERDNR